MAGSGVWHEAEVPITRQMYGTLQEGTFELEIHYGRVGNMELKMTKKFKPTMQFGPAGDLQLAEFSEIT